mmetsp:Transcript_13763/g.37678  ORF Transcript_13763/g.37678 Transcript_13763/m.37678 type:complete len:200 (-) Transcript_13763:3355-3954(-)
MKKGHQNPSDTAPRTTHVESAVRTRRCLTHGANKSAKNSRGTQGYRPPPRREPLLLDEMLADCRETVPPPDPSPWGTFDPRERAAILFIARWTSFSIRAKRSFSSITVSASSGHGFANSEDPPKRLIVSVVVGLADARSKTWIPPAKPMSPGLNSSGSSSCKELTNPRQLRTGALGIISTMISIRRKRAYPTMSSMTSS